MPIKSYLKKRHHKSFIKRLNNLNILHTKPQQLKGSLEAEESTSLQNLRVINACQVGFMTYFGGNCEIRNACIGRYCSIGTDVIIGLYNHPIHSLTTHPICFQGGIKLIDTHYDRKLKRKSNYPNTNQPVTIGHDVWIGHRALIKSNLTVHTGAIIAAGAIVTKDVPAYAIVAGNPARIIKYRFDEDTIADLIATKWWEYDLSKLDSQIHYDVVNKILCELKASQDKDVITKLSIKKYLINYKGLSIKTL